MIRINLYITHVSHLNIYRIKVLYDTNTLNSSKNYTNKVYDLDGSKSIYSDMVNIFQSLVSINSSIKVNIIFKGFFEYNLPVAYAFWNSFDVVEMLYKRENHILTLYCKSENIYLTIFNFDLQSFVNKIS